MEKNNYIKNNEAVYVGTSFIYEVSIYVYFKNYVFLTKTAYYESSIPIEHFVRSFFINKHVEICCDLYQAPLDYLIKNNYESQASINKRKTKQYVNKAASSRIKKL